MLLSIINPSGSLSYIRQFDFHKGIVSKEISPELFASENYGIGVGGWESGDGPVWPLEPGVDVLVPVY